MSEHELANREANIRARLDAARNKLSRPNPKTVLSEDMPIEEIVANYRDKLASKISKQDVRQERVLPVTSLGFLRRNWIFALATLICFVFTSVGSFFFIQPSNAACTPPSNLVSAPTGTLPANIEAFTEINTSMGSAFEITGFTNVRATISVTTGNIKITQTAGLTAPAGFNSGDWTNGSGTAIAFEGTQTDVNAALATLSYKGWASTVTVAASPVDVAYNPDNGNYYLHVAVDADAAASRADALSRELYQCNFGYLATITSASEQAFIESYLTPINMGAFFGGSDEETEGTWKWLDGPEAGQIFWVGDYNTGSAQGGAYTNWNMITNTEPRISDSEDRVALAPSRGWRWADVGTTGAYLIEWTGGQLMEASLSTTSSGTPSLSLSDVNKYMNDADFDLTNPSSPSSGSFSYTISDPSVATVSGNTVTIVGAGSATITAAQSASGAYTSGTATATLTVSKVPVSLAMNDIEKLITDAPFDLVDPVSSSPGAFTFTSDDASVAAIDGNTVTITGKGSTTVTVTQAETEIYESGSTSFRIIVTKNIVTLSMDDINKLTTDDDFSLVNPVSASAGSFSYSSSNKAVATIVGNDVSIHSAGTSTITVTQEETENYEAASTTFLLSISLDNGTISMTDITKLTTDAPFNISNPASASSGSFLYTIDDNSIATISGNTVTLVGAGVATVTVTQSSDGVYDTLNTTFTLTVSKSTAALTLDDINKFITDEPFDIANPSSPSSGAFTYTSSDTSVATISGNRITILNAGATTIEVTQAADQLYEISKTSMKLTVSKLSHSLSFSEITKNTNDKPFTLIHPESQSKGAFNYDIDNRYIATIAGDTVTIQGPGTATITVTQDADDQYQTAKATAKLTVTYVDNLLPEARFEEIRDQVEQKLESQLGASLQRRINGALFLLREKINFHRDLLWGKVSLNYKSPPLVRFNASGDNQNLNADGALQVTRFINENSREKTIFDFKKITGKNRLDATEVRYRYLWDRHIADSLSYQFNVGLDLANSHSDDSLNSSANTKSLSFGANVFREMPNSLYFGAYGDFGLNQLSGNFSNELVSINTNMNTINYAVGAELGSRLVFARSYWEMLSPSLTLEPAFSISHGAERLLNSKFKASNEYGTAEVYPYAIMPTQTRFTLKPVVNYRSPATIDGRIQHHSFTPSYSCEKVTATKTIRQCNYGFAMRLGYWNKTMKTEGEISFNYENLTRGALREFGLRYKIKF